MAKTAAIIQSNYIPWLGYFDMIKAVDVFVFYDDMQYTRRDWRNRNKIKTAQGLSWLTVPVTVKGRFEQKINETKVRDSGWAAKHLRALRLSYGRAEAFAEGIDWLVSLYERAQKYEFLSEINHFFIGEICQRLGITTPLIDSREFEIYGHKSEALLSVLDGIGGVQTYLSGPSAKAYLDGELFKERGYQVEWMSYDHYQPYPQLFGEFERGVTVFDLILNTGTDAAQYLSYDRLRKRVSLD